EDANVVAIKFIHGLWSVLVVVIRGSYGCADRTVAATGCRRREPECCWHLLVWHWLDQNESRRSWLSGWDRLATDWRFLACLRGWALVLPARGRECLVRENSRAGRLLPA